MKKVKRLRQCVWLTAALFVGLAWSSCTKEDAPVNNGGNTQSSYIFNEVFVPQTIVISVHNPLGKHASDFPSTTVNIDFGGEIYNEGKNEVRGSKPLEALRKRAGDIPRPHPYTREPQGGYISFSKGIAAISVETIKAYNDNYPEGSSLAPIIEVTYASCDELVSKLISGEDFVIDNRGLEYRRMLSKGIVECKFPTSRRIKLKFKEKPSDPQVQLRVIVTFDDGSELRHVRQVHLQDLL